MSCREQSHHRAVRRAGDQNALQRQTHGAAQQQGVQRLQVGGGGGDGQFSGEFCGVEVGIENDGDFAEDANDIAAVRGNEMDAVAVRVVNDEVASDAKHLRNSALLEIT